MSAGGGIRHAEYNLEQQPTRIFQIWISPSSKGGVAAHGGRNRSQRRIVLGAS